MVKSDEYIVLGNMATPTRFDSSGAIRYDGDIAFVSKSSKGFEVVCTQYMRERVKDIQYVDMNRTMDPMEMMELFNQRMERSVN